MPSPHFDILFRGQIMEGRDPGSVKEAIGKLFKADAGKVAHLFSGKTICIKSNVDQETAVRYRDAIRNAGALVEIRPAAQSMEEETPEPAEVTANETPAAASPATETEDGDMLLLPPNTGSLIDCAQEVTPEPIPDTSSISLAPEGTTIDESVEALSLEIDTSDLTLNPPQSGSLEDCARPVEPTPIPDISQMELEEQEQKPTQTEQTKAVFAIDD